MSFAADMQRFQRKTRSRANDVYRGAVFKTARAVVKNTPVDTSRLRSNWNSSIGNPDVSVDWDKRDKGRNHESINEVRRVVKRLSVDETFWLSNGVFYGPYVEYGTSKMEPRRFVRGSIARWGRYVKQAASEPAI